MLTRKHRLLVGLAFGCIALVVLSVLTYRRLKPTTQPDADVADLLRDIEATTGLKTRGINVLGDTQSEGVISRLIDYIDEEDWTGRTESWNAAMEALARIGSPAVPKLIQAIRDAPNKAASTRLGDGTKPSDFGIQAETTKIQTRAAMVLGRIGDARALPVLRGLQFDNSLMSFYVKEAIKSIEKSNDRAPRTGVDQASSDDEVYEVYSTAIRHLFLKGIDETKSPDDPEAWVVVIKHHTIPYRWDESDDPAKRTLVWAKKRVVVDSRTVEDFKRKCQDSVSLEPRFTFPARQVLISDEELRNSFKNGWSWPEFYERYPKSVGIVVLSRVGFNPEHDQAFLYIGKSCSSLCGGGYYVLVAKEGGAWSVKHKDMLWVL